MVSIVPPVCGFPFSRKYHDLRSRARKKARTAAAGSSRRSEAGSPAGPVGRQQRDVRLGEEALADQRDDPAVLGRADEPARGLDDAGHARDEVGVLEAALVAVVEVAPEELALGADLGQCRGDDDDLGEHLARVVHTLGEDPAEDGQEEHGLVVAHAGGPASRCAACRSRPPSEPRSGDPAPSGGRRPPAERRRRERAPARCGRQGQAPRPARRCGRTSAGGRGSVVSTSSTATIRRFSRGNGEGSEMVSVRSRSKPRRSR